MRTVPKLASHTGPKRAAPCTWGRGCSGHLDTWAGTFSLTCAHAKGVDWAWEEGASAPSKVPSYCMPLILQTPPLSLPIPRKFECDGQNRNFAQGRHSGPL